MSNSQHPRYTKAKYDGDRQVTPLRTIFGKALYTIFALGRNFKLFFHRPLSTRSQWFPLGGTALFREQFQQILKWPGTARTLSSEADRFDVANLDTLLWRLDYLAGGKVIHFHERRLRIAQHEFMEAHGGIGAAKHPG